MFDRIKVIDSEVATPPSSIGDLDGYQAVRLLFRLHGSVVGVSTLPVIAGQVSAFAIAEALLRDHSTALLRIAVGHALLSSGLHRENLPADAWPPPPPAPSELPFISVAICTRNRTADLRTCLPAVAALEYPHFEVLVVDNAPSSGETRNLIAKEYPSFRYLLEPHPGLDNARNLAAREARGEVIAYVDDDARPDRLWLRAIGRLFGENPQAMAVTGLVMPAELESDAQHSFEFLGGFGKGFERRWILPPKSGRLPWTLLGTGQFGTGTNMAFRRVLFEQIGEFDPALDVGTCTNGGGDLEFLLRTLKGGNMLVYEPNAIVWHRHRRDIPALERQMRANGIGFAAFLSRTSHAFPEERPGLVRLVYWCLSAWYLPRIFFGSYRPMRVPLRLSFAEFWGFVQGIGRYRRACREGGHDLPQPAKRVSPPTGSPAIAIRSVEVSEPLQALTGLQDFGRVRIYFTFRGIPIAMTEMTPGAGPISAVRLAEEAQSLLPQDSRCFPDPVQFMAQLRRLYRASISSPPPGGLNRETTVSIIIATRDRPDDLRRCLASLVAQKTPRQLEILVIDNHPGSQPTAKVVEEFPSIRLLQEPRPGPSYARNAGIRAASGDIIISTDDDVWAPPDWVENLVAPFGRADVTAVTGNILPASLDQPSEQLFERYGGLGRGFEPKEANASWFESFRRRAVPTWHLGGTANAAFRATIFRDPAIGLMDETLGTPAGGGEDTYLFYKILRAGKTILYQPSAWVLHHHRSSMEALRRQLFNYSKGHVAYHLTTWLNDGDWRGLYQVSVGLPAYWLWRIRDRMIRRNTLPLSLLRLEISGSLAGPWAFWKARRQVKKWGREPLPKTGSHEKIPTRSFPANQEAIDP